MDSNEFSVFYSEMHPRVFRFIQARFSHDSAEDLANETMITLWQKQPPRPRDEVTLRQLRAFTYRIADGHIRNAERKLARERRLTERLSDMSPESQDHHEDPTFTAAQPSDVLECITGLVESEREAVVLRAIGFKTSEIAEIPRITPKAASMRLARAKSRIENKLPNIYDKKTT